MKNLKHIIEILLTISLILLTIDYSIKISIIFIIWSVLTVLNYSIFHDYNEYFKLQEKEAECLFKEFAYKYYKEGLEDGQTGNLNKKAYNTSWYDMKNKITDIYLEREKTKK